MARVNPARVAAARALVEVENGGRLDEALAGLSPGSGPDRDLAWFLGFGVTRRRGQVDAALRGVLSRPLGSLDAEVRAVLRLGAFEALFARTPRHALVHQAVEVSRRLGVGRASAMVNAVLRRVRAADSLHTAESFDHPEWLLARWTDRYGREAARAWCLDNGEPPPLFVVTRDGEAPAGLDGAEAVLLDDAVVPGCWRIPSAQGRVERMPGFDEGRWWVMDAAAAVVADLVPVEPGMRVLDACAAPGGKAFRLASRGAAVTAVDRSAERMKLIADGQRRLGLEISRMVHDWGDGALPAETFDAVLVDAPCSGLGTVRRHPEIRWRRQPQDLARAAERQAQILAAAAEHVAPGGCLVYGVCSSEPEEGPEIVRSFLDSGSPFDLEIELCTAPPKFGEDAHYGGRLRRRP